MLDSSALYQKTKASTSDYRVVVPALDTLIGNPSLLDPEENTPRIADRILIPGIFIDYVHRFRSEQNSRGEAAVKLSGLFANILEDIHYRSPHQKIFTCKNGVKVQFITDSTTQQYKLEYPKNLSRLKNQNSAHSDTILTALFGANKAYLCLDDDVSVHVAVLTGDDYTTSLALLNGVEVLRIDHSSAYSGRRRLEMPEDAYQAWFSQGYFTEAQFKAFFPKEDPLVANEFVEFVFCDEALSETYKPSNCFNFTERIGRFNCLLPEFRLEKLHYIHRLPKFFKLRTAGQAMFAEALLAPSEEIPVVVCPSIFGTGKTFLAVAIGIFLVADNHPEYERIFVCPRDSELGKEIGFLPGNESEKVIAKSMPVIDNVRAYFKVRGDRSKGGELLNKKQLDDMVTNCLDKYFDFVAIVNMGGRSIANSWIIYDEAQDLERFQINQLMKRIGDGSKMIIIGDPHQVYNRHMNRFSNGLSYAASKMAGSPYAAVIAMNEAEITRSEAAREIARCLDH